MIYTSFRIFQFLSAKYEEWAKIIKHQHQFTCLKHMALSSSTNGGSRLRSLASSCRVLSLLTRALQMNSARLEYKHPIWSMKYDEIRMILILFKFNHSCFAKPQPERLNITVTAPWDKPVQKASAQSTPPDAAGYRHIPGRNNEPPVPPAFTRVGSGWYLGKGINETRNMEDWNPANERLIHIDFTVHSKRFTVNGSFDCESSNDPLSGYWVTGFLTNQRSDNQAKVKPFCKSATWCSLDILTFNCWTINKTSAQLSCGKPSSRTPIGGINPTHA